MTEPVTLWVRVDLQRVALQGEDGDATAVRWPTIAFALALTDALALALLFDEVQTVLGEAELLGLLPLARDGAAVLAGEREDLQAIIVAVADEELDQAFACRRCEQLVYKENGKFI